MKNMFYQLLFVVLISCSNSTTEKKAANEEAVSNKKPDASISTPSTPGDDLIGDWKLTLETYDDNDNKQLDDAERKKAFSNHYFFRFSPDGNCLINAIPKAQSAFKGHYTREKQNGKEKISVFIDEGGKSETNGSYWVISVNKEELVLLDGEAEHAFWILKRA